MHGMHARLPKNFVLEERLERYADVIELVPTQYAGRWADACRKLGADGGEGDGDGDGDSEAGGGGGGGFRSVRVDLGCGKGAYVVQAAADHPDTLFLAIDVEPICVAYTAQHVTEAGLANVVVVPARGDQVARILGKGEVDAITLNFPTPFPRKKDAGMRLTSLERLMDYRHVLAPGGTVTLKTDSFPLWEFSKIQFDLAGYELLWVSEDARGERAGDYLTEYERRLCAQGATVFAIEATPGPAPEVVRQTASLSLVDYLPADLEGLGYVPHGMQGTVTNLRNRRRRRGR